MAGQRPSQVDDEVDIRIGYLNKRWDLRLPRPDGSEAQSSERCSDIAKSCSSKIRYLCRRFVDVNKIISDFENGARPIHRQWVNKPLQEPGTLPNDPVTKVFRVRDVQITQTSKVVSLSDTERGQLLKLLHDTLQDEYGLAEVSMDYERQDGDRPLLVHRPPATVSERRTGGPSTPSCRSIRMSETTVCRVGEPQLKYPESSSTKRSLSSMSGVSILCHQSSLC
jgi:hypothetical protein